MRTWAIATPAILFGLILSACGGGGGGDAAGEPVSEEPVDSMVDSGIEVIKEDDSPQGEKNPRDPSVVKNGDVWLMYYTTEKDTKTAIAVALSKDGINWTKKGLIKIEGSTGMVSNPCVLWTKSGYTMWFHEKNEKDGKTSIKIAFSEKGMTFVKALPCSFENKDPRVDFVVVELSKGLLMYSVASMIETSVIRCESSTDGGVTWKNAKSILSLAQQIKGISFRPDSAKFPLMYLAQDKVYATSTDENAKPGKVVFEKAGITSLSVADNQVFASSTSFAGAAIGLSQFVSK